MVCPFCLHTKTQVYNSRQTAKLSGVWRRRKCLKCQQEFTTREYTDPSTILKVQKQKGLTPYSRVKLLVSVLKAVDHRPDAEAAAVYLCETIEQQLYQLGTKNKQIIAISELIEAVSRIMKRFDPIAYVKYIGNNQPALKAAELRRQLKK